MRRLNDRVTLSFIDKRLNYLAEWGFIQVKNCDKCFRKGDKLDWIQISYLYSFIIIIDIVCKGIAYNRNVV